MHEEIKNFVQSMGKSFKIGAIKGCSKRAGSFAVQLTQGNKGRGGGCSLSSP